METFERWSDFTEDGPDDRDPVAKLSSPTFLYSEFCVAIDMLTGLTLSMQASLMTQTSVFLIHVLTKC